MTSRSGLMRTPTAKTWPSNSLRLTSGIIFRSRRCAATCAAWSATIATAHPALAEQTALERFYFCESVEVTLPFGLTARTLEEFRDGIAHLEPCILLLPLPFVAASPAIANQ